MPHRIFFHIIEIILVHDFTLINFHNYSERIYIPLGCLYLISMLKKNNFKVKFLDMQLCPYSAPLSSSSFLKFIQNPQSSVIGFSCMADTLPLAVLAAKALKENYNDITIIFGGPGPTGASKELIKNFSFIDIVTSGEGEITLLEALKAVNSNDKYNALKNVKGIIYKDERKKIKTNPPRERMKNLDLIPLPAYEEIDLSLYSSSAGPLITSRGCSYKCAFCDVRSIWRNKTLHRSIDNILKEIKLLVNDYNFKEISIKDDIFTISKGRIKEFSSKIKKTKLEFKWDCFGRINSIDKNCLPLMAQAGCKNIFYGIESGSNKILNKIKKGFTIEKAHEVVLESLKHMGVTATFIWGFPFEEVADFYQTVLWMVYLSKAGVDVGGSRFIPYPLTSLYQSYKNKLEFKPEFISFFLKDYAREENLLNLIKKHPHIFTCFYRLEDKNYKNKEEFIKQVEKVLL